MNKTPDHINEDEIDEDRRRLLCGLGAFMISLPFIALGFRESCMAGLSGEVQKEAEEEPAKAPLEKPKLGRKYLGLWRSVGWKQNTVRISNSNFKPKNKLVIDGHVARLLRSAHVRMNSLYDVFDREIQHYSVSGGIYRVDGKQDVFIGEMRRNRYLLINLIFNNANEIEMAIKVNFSDYDDSWKWYPYERIMK